MSTLFVGAVVQVICHLGGDDDPIKCNVLYEGSSETEGRHYINWNGNRRVARLNNGVLEFLL